MEQQKRVCGAVSQVTGQNSAVIFEIEAVNSNLIQMEKAGEVVMRSFTDGVPISAVTKRTSKVCHASISVCGVGQNCGCLKVIIALSLAGRSGTKGQGHVPLVSKTDQQRRSTFREGVRQNTVG